jgi:hypothetical protein
MRSSRVKVLFISGIILLNILYYGCSRNTTEPDQVVGSGRLVSQLRASNPFTGIQVTGVGKVIIKQDTVQTLVVQADDNIIDRVTTSVSNGVLIVGLQQGSYSSITININVSMQAINRLECIGTAEFLNSGQIQTDSIVCRITGAGKITLTGTATQQTVQITGAGDVHNFGLASSHCLAMISGAGNVEVNVTQQLDAIINGTGSVTYTGDPQVVNKTITGIGNISAGH